MSFKNRNITISSNPNWLSFLGVILVLLKLFNVPAVADVSWWLILLPFYIGLAIIGVIVVGGAILTGVAFGVAVIADYFIARKRAANRRKDLYK